MNRPTQKRLIPSVLTREEVASLFQFLDGEMGLLARGGGMPAPCGRPTMGRSAAASSIAVTPT